MPTRRAAGVDAEIDALFQLSLAEFTSARNALAARLKKEGRPIDAERVKSLTKPPAPAWAANQLYWQSPKSISQLLAVAERVRKTQTGQIKNADLRELLGEKKRITAELMQKAEVILREGGHAASPDAMRRVSATLEALAMWGDTEGAPKAGRLTADLDPPGFDALAAVIGGRKLDSARVLSFRSRKTPEDRGAARARTREDSRAAEKMLREATRRAAAAHAAMTKANARATALEKQKQEIDARYAQARDNARKASSEANDAARALADAERSLAKAKADLE